MAAPFFAVEQFREAFLALLPRGKVWPRGTSSTLGRTVGALAPTHAALANRAGALVADAFPGSTLELLPEWEATTGLPDACQGEAPTIEARRAQVVARFANTGGQSVPHLVQFAADLGYPITVTEYAPSRAGTLAAGYPVMSEASAHAISIGAAVYNQRFFRAGLATAGDPLSSWSNAVLECELRAIAPAQAQIIFTYT